METGFITEVDRYLFGEGTHYEIYKKLGAHLTEYEGEKGVYFAVWAPNARNVSVVGDFNGWMGYNHNMTRLGTSGIYELFVPGLTAGELYKFAIVTPSGQTIMKADPFGNYSEMRPNTASIVTDITGFEWTDKSWEHRSNPMAIYEVHIGSWKKTADVEAGGFYNYVDMAHELGAYVKEMGYTHVELMGIAEHPFDGSWGYQVTGYFAPTSRYGTPKDFMYFVNYMHSMGIGVILDWVPAHFPRDSHGLANFDGTCVYEYADSRKGEHPDWGTKIFDYAKHEVSNFLIANALYWLKEFHVDGLRVDAVASMLYLDYGKTPGNWVPNQYGGHENLEAIEFFRHLNSVIARQVPNAIVIAEESTAWPNVTKTPEDGGLGFVYKWNMGWMNDFLEYVKTDSLYKKFSHNKMTFSMTYAFSEKYILVLSHDEVVHLKCSMLEKMPGYFEDKFENLKTAYTFMFGHPGKKLLFMGQEFGQLREWSEERSLDWFLLQEKEHKNLQEYVKRLLHLYTSHPAMTELDESWEGFEWMNCEDGDRSTFSFVRKDKAGKRCLLFVMNFTPMLWERYRVGVQSKTGCKVLLDSYKDSFETTAGRVLKTEEIPCDNQDYSIEFDLKPMQSLIMEFTMTEKKVKVEDKENQDEKEKSPRTTDEKRTTEKKVEKKSEKVEKKTEKAANNKKTSSVS